MGLADDIPLIRGAWAAVRRIFATRVRLHSVKSVSMRSGATEGPGQQFGENSFRADRSGADVPVSRAGSGRFNPCPHFCPHFGVISYLLVCHPKHRTPSEVLLYVPRCREYPILKKFLFPRYRVRDPDGPPVQRVFSDFDWFPCPRFVDIDVDFMHKRVLPQAWQRCLPAAGRTAQGSVQSPWREDDASHVAKQSCVSHLVSKSTIDH